MNIDLLFAALIAVSMLSLFIFKTHIAFVILALCTGFVLSEFAGPDVFNFMKIWISPSEFPLLEVVRIVLLLMPALMIGHRFRKTQYGVGRLIQQILPALALTLLTVVFVVDILPVNTVEGETESVIAGVFEDFSAFIVLFAVGIALFDVLIKHANEPVRRRRKPGRPKS